MAEYIEREALEAELNRRLSDLLNRYGEHDHYSSGYAECVDAVEDFPAAADVVPVVRCEDCKHSYDDLGGLTCSYGVCVDCTVPPDFSCSCGAKMDGEP